MSWRSWLPGLQQSKCNQIEPRPIAPDDPNGHLRSYLQHYFTFDRAPGFAVLLTGLWGSGKTFQARKILDDLVGPSGYVFISLNGISKREELDDAVFAAVYPWTQHKGVQVGTALGKALLKHAKVDLPKLDSAQLTTRSAASIYVFDDFERCRLDRTESLGYINEFVERDGRKVVIIADESKMLDDKRFVDGKEKVVGKTLEVVADFASAFSYFVSLTNSQTAVQIFLKHAQEIERVYVQSELRNLRILQQTMDDYERVVLALDDHHLKNGTAIAHLLKMFFALSFELRAGRIQGDDLRNRVDRIVAGMVGEKQPTPMSIANSRYQGIELSDSILSDDVLLDILVRGKVDARQIKQAVDASSWFVSGDEPSWRAVWHAFERDDDQTAIAAAEMLEDFNKRAFYKSGEVLHLFGEMLWLSDIRVSGLTRKRTVEQCKLYVDDLRKAGQLEPILRRFPDNISFGAYGGLSFYQIDTKEFKELREYLNEQRQIAETESLADVADRLATLALSDPTQFTREIAFGREANATFAEVPVFSRLKPNKFAAQLVRLPPWHFREILLGFSLRYDMSALAHRLADERAWAEDFERELNKQAKKLNKFGRERVRRQVEWSIGKELAELKQREAQAQAAAS